MNYLRKRLVISFCVDRGADPMADQDWDIGLSFSPAASPADNGNTVDLEIMISGLEDDDQVHSFRNLAQFKFCIHYGSDDPDGDGYLLDARNADHWHSDAFWEETLNLSKRSDDYDIRDLGAYDAVTLATVSFKGFNLGDHVRSALDIRLDDDMGKTLSVTLGKWHHKDVTDRSKPSKMRFLGCGLVGLASLKRCFFAPRCSLAV